MFAEAHSTATGEKKVHLVGDNETEEIFESFLELATTGHVEITDNIDDIDSTAQLGLFLQKWDCPLVLISLILSIKVKVLSRELPRRLGFVFGAIIDSEDTATTSLGAAGVTWTAGNDTWGIEGRCELDVRAWPLSFWKIVKDPHYLFALSRAFETDGNDPTRLAAKFSQLLATAKSKWVLHFGGYPLLLTRR